MGLPVPKPLPTILLTRPQAQSEQFAKALKEHGCRNDILISPLLKISAATNAKKLTTYDEAIFTSRNALDFAPVEQKRAWCVGDTTAAKARALGWGAVSAGGNVDDLYEAIVKANPSGKLVHWRGNHSRGALADRLNQAGIETESGIVYRQDALQLSPEALKLLTGQEPVIIPLFSPRSAGKFAQEGPYLAPLHGIAMSHAVFQKMHHFDADQIIVSPKPTAASMLDCIVSLIDAA